MSGIDTSAAAVERLAAEATHEPWEVDALATLRALLAERDEAIDQRNAADFVLALSIEQSNRHSAERDAARVEVERLNEALIRERHGWQAEVERLRREVMRAGGVAP